MTMNESFETVLEVEVTPTVRGLHFNFSSKLDRNDVLFWKFESRTLV